MGCPPAPHNDLTTNVSRAEEGTPDLVGVELPETKDMPKRVRNGILFQDLKKEKKNSFLLFPVRAPANPPPSSHVDTSKAAASACGGL